MQGRTMDAPLTEAGVEHARLNAQAVAREGIDAIIASPLGRVRASAQPLCELTGLTPSFDDRLMEWDGGDWSNSLYREVPTRWPDAWAKWEDDPWTHGPPNGENLTQLQARGALAIDDVLRQGTDRVAIVSHGFIGRIMMGALLRLSNLESQNIETPNDRVHTLHRDGGGWRVERMDAGGLPQPGLVFKDGRTFVA